MEFVTEKNVCGVGWCVCAFGGGMGNQSPSMSHHHPHHDLWRNLQVGHGTFVFCLLRDRDSREEILKKSSLASTHIRTRNTKEELVL